MTFIKKLFNPSEELILPAIPTKAITAMKVAFDDLFKKGLPDPGLKPTTVTCFDTSGSGKTATVAEAARLCGASWITISPYFSPFLSGVLQR